MGNIKYSNIGGSAFQVKKLETLQYESRLNTYASIDAKFNKKEYLDLCSKDPELIVNFYNSFKKDRQTIRCLYYQYLREELGSVESLIFLSVLLNSIEAYGLPRVK